MSGALGAVRTPGPEPLYIGVDVGTSGVRACAVGADLAERAGASRALPPPERADERSEQDPELWWRALEACLSELLEQIPARAVQRLAVDGTSGTLLLADARGQPLGPALMYDDQRARHQAQRIAEHAPATSGAHGASSSLAKLLYLLESSPNADRAAYALHAADWLAGRLTGRFGIADENNVLKLGYDPITRHWPAWLTDLGVPPGLLPAVVPAGTPIDTVDATLADAWGLPRESQVVAGTTDSVAGLIATGATAPGEAVTSLGSTLVLKVISPQAVFSPEHGVYSHRLGDLWLPGGASNAGGAVLLQHFTEAELEALTPRLRPERPTGLDYYPLPRAGERFPHADPELPPRLEPRPETRVELFQAILEGLARIEHQGYRQLAELGAPYPVSVRTLGGGAANRPWARIRHRELGVPLIPAAHEEAAHGAARLAARGPSGAL